METGTGEKNPKLNKNVPKKIKYKEGEKGLKSFPTEKVPSEKFCKSPDFNKPTDNRQN